MKATDFLDDVPAADVFLGASGGGAGRGSVNPPLVRQNRRDRIRNPYVAPDNLDNPIAPTGGSVLEGVQMAVPSFDELRKGRAMIDAEIAASPLSRPRAPRPVRDAKAIGQDIFSILGNTGVQLVKPFVDVPNIVTGGALDPIAQFLENAGKAANLAASPTTQYDRETLSRIPEGQALEKAAQLISNPGLAANMGVPSAASMVMPLVAARGAAMLAPRTAAALGDDFATGAAIGANALMNAGDTFGQTEGDLAARLIAALGSGASSALVGKATGGGLEGQLARRGGGIRNIPAAIGSIGRESVQEFGENFGNQLAQDTGEGKPLNFAKAIDEGTIGAILAPFVAGPVNVASLAGNQDRSNANLLAQALQGFDPTTIAPNQVDQSITQPAGPRFDPVAAAAERAQNRAQEAPAAIPALPYDPGVKNPTTPIVVDPGGNARPMTAAEFLASDETRQAATDIGLTPDVRRAQQQRAAGQAPDDQQAQPPAPRQAQPQQPQQEQVTDVAQADQAQPQQTQQPALEPAANRPAADVPAGVQGSPGAVTGDTARTARVQPPAAAIGQQPVAPAAPGAPVQQPAGRRPDLQGTGQPAATRSPVAPAPPAPVEISAQEQATYNEARDKFNMMVPQLRAAREAGNKVESNRLIDLMRPLDLTMRRLQASVQRRGLAAGQQQQQATSTQRYAGAPVGARERPSEFPEERGLYWEKTAPNTWQKRGSFGNSSVTTRTDEQMNGTVAMRDGAAAAPAAPRETTEPAQPEGRLSRPARATVEKTDSGFEISTNPDGSITVNGDAEQIRALLPEGIVGRAAANAISFSNTVAHRVRAALEGMNLTYSRAGKVVGKLPVKNGKYVGAPAKFDTPAKIPHLRKWLRKLADEGAPGRFWYENSSREVLQMVGGDVQEARRFVALLAIYSQQAKVDANTTFALRAWAQYKAGQPISVKTKVMDEKAQAALDDVDEFWSGEKTGNFFHNLLSEIDPATKGKQGATIDMWMMRAGQYATDAPTVTQYAFMENETNRLAAELGWEPQQVQAAIWVAMKARMENKQVKADTEAKSERRKWIRFERKIDEETGKAKKVRVILNEQKHRDNWLEHAFAHDPTTSDTQAAKFDFSDGVRRHIGQVSWEPRPSTKLPILPGIHSAPYEQQVEFQQAVQRALQDDQGNDMLAMRLGLLTDGQIAAPGIWEGDISAGGQVQMAMAPAKGDAGKEEIDPEQKKLLDAYSAMLGLLLHQDGVGYHRPFYTTTKAKQNAVELRIGKPFTPEQATQLWSALDRRMRDIGVADWEQSAGMISSPEGMRVVNFGALSDNGSFRKLVEDAATEVDHDGPIEPGHFASDGNLVMNAWKEDQDGQGFTRTIAAAGRQDLLGWGRDVLAPRVQKVFDDYSAKYGWGNPGDAAQGFAAAQATPAVGNGTKAPTGRLSRPDKPFYSALSRQVAAIPAKAQPAAGWQSNIEGLVKAGKVKAAEVEWSGVIDWLDLQDGKVTKDQVTEYLDANGVRVEETVLGDGGLTPDELQEVRELNELYRRAEAGEDVVFDAADFDRLQFLEAQKADENLVQYQSYQLPGGTNYREVLLTLPDKTNAVDEHRAFLARLKAKYPGTITERNAAMTPQERQQLEQLGARANAEREGPRFRSAHWEQPNVLAHIRVNDRVDADGKKVLFVEEIQSDWGQAGKKHGFEHEKNPVREPVGEIRYEPEVTEYPWGIYIDGVEDNRSKGDRAHAEEVLAESMELARARARREAIDGVVPNAPFVTKTDAWLSLALRRIVKMAADGGYDRVAFIDGKQSADRYKLSKTVNYIQWNPGFSSDPSVMRSLVQLETIDGRTIGFEVDTPEGGKGVIAEGNFAGKTLEDVLGKEVAQKINESDSGDLRGLGLEIGGEGMQAFYGKIVPNTLRDVLKKLGGGALETVVIEQDPNPALDKWEPEDGPGDGSRAAVVKSSQPGFTVTDAMRAKVATGVPLFSRANPKAASATVDTLRSALVSRFGPVIERMEKRGFLKIWPSSQAFNEGQTSNKIDGPAQGYWDGRVAHLFATGIEPGNEVAVMLHEVGEHASMEDMLGPKAYDKLVTRAYDLLEAGDPIAERALARIPEDTPDAFRDSEFLAYMIEIVAADGAKAKPTARKWLADAIAAIRAWFSQTGLNKRLEKFGQGLKLTPDDIAALAVRAVKWQAEQRTPARAAPTPVDIQLSERDDQTRTPAFKKWFGDSKVVDAAGKPLVVYHGTTNTFTEFDRSRGNIGSDMGAGFYFSSTPDDVEANYAGEGPDLTQRIELLAERISSNDDIDMDEAREKARKELSEGASQTMPVYLAIKNPVVLGGKDETFLDYTQEVDEDGEYTGEEGGKLTDILMALQGLENQFEDFNYGTLVNDIMAEASENQGIDASRLIEVAKASEGLMYAIDEQGELASTEILRQAFSEAGFDGVIDNTVNEKFGSNRKTGKQMVGMDDETVHYIAFEPNQIKSAIGNRGTFDANSNDIRFSRPARPTNAAAAAARVFGGSPTPPAQPPGGNPQGPSAAAAQPWSVVAPGRRDDFIRYIQNNRIDIKRTVDAVKAAGATIADDANPYLQDELYLGKVRDQLDRLADDHVTPLLRAIANSPFTPAQVNEYLWARHAEERNRQMAKVNAVPFTPALDLAGMSTTDANAALARFRAMPNFRQMQAIARMVDQITHDARTRIVTDGLEDASVIQAWEGAYKHYVPLQRDVEESGGRAAGYNVKGSESRRAVGSDKAAINILANVIAQAEAVIIRSEKAAVGRSVLDMARQHPNPSFWTVDTPPTERVIDPRTGLVTVRAKPNYKTLDNVFVVKEAGVEHFVTFNEKNPRAVQFARTLKNMDAAEMGPAMRAVNSVTRYLASWVTSRNPLFWMTNFARDVQGVAFNLQNTPIRGQAPQVMANIPAALGGFARFNAGKKTGRWTQLANEFSEAGGRTGYLDNYRDSVHRMDEIIKEIDRMGQSHADPRRIGRAVLDVLEAANDSIENGVRLAAYAQARENGMSKDQAASLAKNITVNFNRKGNATAVYNTLFMFFNANVQGNVRMLTAIKESRRAQFYAGALTAAGAAVALMNYATGGEDDETKKKRYSLVPEWERERNWIVFIPGTDTYIKVPLPIGPHVLFNAGRVLAEIAYEEDADPLQKAASFVSSAISAFNPVGGGMPTGDTKGAIQMVTPTVARPVMDLVVNQNFAGTPISRDNNFPGYKKPNYLQGRERTPAYWTAAAKAMNDWTGGDTVKPGKVNMSPEQLAYLVKGYVVPGIAQTVDKVAGQAMSRKETPPDQIVGASKFFGKVDEFERSRAAYDIMRKDEQAVGEFKQYLKDGDREKANEALKRLGGGSLENGRKIMGQYLTTQKILAAARKQKRLRPGDDDTLDAADERVNRTLAVYLANTKKLRSGESE